MSLLRRFSGSLALRAGLVCLLTFLLVSGKTWLAIPNPASVQHSALPSHGAHAKRLCLVAIDGLQFSRLLSLSHVVPPLLAFGPLPPADDPVLPLHQKVAQYNRPPPVA